MKKIIAVASLTACMGFAIAIANATDSASQQAGTAAESTDSMPETTSDSTDRWASARTCTDDNGVTTTRGKTGFDACVDQMRKKDRRNESGDMGGTVSEPENETGSGSSLGNGPSTSTDSAAESSQ